MLGGPEIVSIYIGATESQPISTNLKVLLTVCDDPERSEGVLADT